MPSRLDRRSKEVGHFRHAAHLLLFIGLYTQRYQHEARINMYKVIEVMPQDGYKLLLAFDNGDSGTVDLAPLAGKGVFAAWIDPEVFRAVQIGPQGELAWGDEIDLCPDALYLEATGKNVEDIFPALNFMWTYVLGCR